MASPRSGRSTWIAIIFLIWTPVSAITRERLDKCQEKLTHCYERCKARGKAPKACNKNCTTAQCGLPWRESYGDFIDRRIEENAARAPSKFIGLKRLRGRRQEQKQYPEQFEERDEDYQRSPRNLRQRRGEPGEERGPFEGFLSFFGLQ